VISEDHWRPPPKKEPASLITPARSEESRAINISQLNGMQVRPQCRDVWLENYLGYIERLNCQFGSEPSPTRAVAVATRRYSTFCRSCCPIHRRNTWRALHKAVAFFRYRN